ncbi:MAG TPA: hypothetical protein VIM55_11570 [Mucilaginibacter sp.]
MEQKQYTILIYTQFFGTTQLPPKNLDKIKGLDRDNVLRFLISIKIAVTKTYGKNITHPFIQLLLKNLPRNHANRLTTMLSMDNQAYFLTHPVVINQIVADILNEPEDQLMPRINQLDYFAVAMLELLMIYNDHHFKTLDIGKSPDNHDLIWKMMQMQNINGNNPASFVRCGIIKQAIFLEFLKEALGEKYEAFDKLMSNMIGIKALVNSALLYVQLQAVQDRTGKTDKPLVVIAPNDEYYPVIEKLRLVIDLQQKEGTYDSGRVIMHPFLKLSDNRLYLTGTHDFSLITEKGWEYFLFSAGQIGKFIPEIKDINGLRSFIGYRYIEKFLMGKLFNSLNRAGCRVILSDDQKTPDVTMIINEIDVFIFEIKSVALNYKVWQEQDLEGFKKYLDEQFVKGKKGVSQLHKCMGHLASQAGKLFGLHTPLHKLRIYPIIIFTEPQLTIHAVNDYVIEQAPAIPQNLNGIFKSIAPVTMIHYDFFLENLKVIRENKAVLKNAINYYHQTVAARKVQHQKVNSTANYLNAMQSFDNLVAGFSGLYEVDQQTIAKELAKVFNPASQND